jgi:nitrogen fixation protein NifB
VLGIAGPGDPLANPTRTFATFAGLTEKAPDIRLCVSTNGLMLPRHVDELCKHNIDHVTITINCIDPEIGARIYPWILWEGRRVHGVEAAAILIEQQLTGLELLAERGVLVKINSVLIPGVNDQHLAEVSRLVKEKGALLHNIMPLISAPEHGTHFGLTGQRGPTQDELQRVRQACATDMEIMSHCRQCRADAIGMLGEDRHAEFSLERIEHMEINHVAAMERRARTRAAIEAKREATREAKGAGLSQGVLIPLERLTRSRDARSRVAPSAVAPKPLAELRIAVASSDGESVDQAFTDAHEFLIYGIDASGARLLERRCLSAAKQTPAAEQLSDCSAVLCTRFGFGAWQSLEAAGLRPLSAKPGSVLAPLLRQAHADWQCEPTATAAGVQCNAALSA